MSKTIIDLIEGEKAIVVDCGNWRLLEHGFIPGTKVVIYKKFFGLTSVYLRGAVIACRNKDYEKVTVNELNED